MQYGKKQAPGDRVTLWEMSCCKTLAPGIHLDVHLTLMFLNAAEGTSTPLHCNYIP